MVKRLSLSKFVEMRTNVADDFCDLFCLDDQRKKVEIHIPIFILTRAAAEATRKVRSYELRKRGGHLRKIGDFVEMPICDMRNCGVMMESQLEPPAVVLVIDKGTDTELAYRIPPATARRIGQDLIGQSEQCLDMPTGRTDH